jgi:hypothetical protein
MDSNGSNSQLQTRDMYQAQDQLDEFRAEDGCSLLGAILSAYCTSMIVTATCSNRTTGERSNACVQHPRLQREVEIIICRLLVNPETSPSRARADILASKEKVFLTIRSSGEDDRR